MKLQLLLEDIKRFKYPRTYHLPFSLGATSDDKILKSTEHLEGKQVVITEKLDGENTTLYNDYYHARSIDSKDHPSRHYVKQLHSQIKREIPDGWRIVGENLFAQHSIAYDELPDYFMVFAIFNDKNECLSWSETKEYCELLGLHTVPELYVGKWDEQLIRKLWNGIGAFPTFETDKQNPVFPCDFFPCQAEGFVVRLAGEFSVHDFSHSVAKMVRPNHVKTDSHWMEKTVIQNLLKESQNG